MSIKTAFIFIITLSVSFAAVGQQKKAPVKAPASKATPRPQPAKAEAPVEKGAIFFEKTSHDFGEVDEDRGRVEARFIFTNIGKGAIRILSVEAGCGCTSGEWEKRPYKQGEKGVINITFNPKDQEGPFTRTVNVVTDGDPGTTFLSLEGSVYGPTKTTKALYPYVSGNMRISHNILSMPHVAHNHPDSTFIRLHNTTDNWISIKSIGKPDYLKAEANTTQIQPKGYVWVNIKIYPDAVKLFGPVDDEIKIVTSDTEEPIKRIGFKANIEENFDIRTPEEKKAPPKISFKETSKDLGELYIGETVDFEFEVTNKGKSPLILRRAYGSCGCTVGTVSAEPIKKGKTGKVMVHFDAKRLYGRQSKNITVISNDPVNPVSVLTITANVVPDGAKK